MLFTLQRYLARELLKTFALTAIGLTLTFSLCGGVFNMIQAEVLTAVQLFRLLMFVLPISLTLTLPVSALFACAMVYGRFAADNEFDACRASGINLHRLLAPALALSLFTAGFTYTFTNHLIPTFIGKLEELIRWDIQKVVYHALTNRGYGKFKGYVLHAGDTHLYDEDAHLKTILIENAAFLELEDGELNRCGTAKSAQIDFVSETGLDVPAVAATLKQVRIFDVRRHQIFENSEQPFDPMQIPSEIKLDVKWLTLPQLLYFRRHPLELPSTRDRLMKLRWLVREAQFYRYATEQLARPGGELRLADDQVAYLIRAKRVLQNPKSFRPEPREVEVVETRAEGQRRYTADTCVMDLSRDSMDEQQSTLTLSLAGNVTMSDASRPTAEVNRNKWDLDRLVLREDPPGMPASIDQTTLLGNLEDVRALKDDLPALGLGSRVEAARASDRSSIFELQYEISGIIHSRLAFSASTLAILVLAAALGIIFRGGQMLTAFVISFVPGLLVVVLNVMGRQLAENAGTHLIGIGVIWAGIAVVAVAELVVIFGYLKR